MVSLTTVAQLFNIFHMTCLTIKLFMHTHYIIMVYPVRITAGLSHTSLSQSLASKNSNLSKN